jgi:hypothetical protein
MTDERDANQPEQQTENVGSGTTASTNADVTLGVHPDYSNDQPEQPDEEAPVEEPPAEEPVPELPETEQPPPVE